MANEDGDSVVEIQYHVTHEINKNGTYQLTVFEQQTGRLCFSWALPVDQAFEVADLMHETLEGWRDNHE